MQFQTGDDTKAGEVLWYVKGTPWVNYLEWSWGSQAEYFSFC